MRKCQSEGLSSRKPELEPGDSQRTVKGVFVDHWLSLSTGHLMGRNPTSPFYFQIFTSVRMEKLISSGTLHDGGRGA